MNVALVYDRVNKIGGAERVLTALHELWPHAPLFTSVYDPKKAAWARDFDVRTTFLQHLPFAKRHHEWLAWLTPFAFGSLSFDGYDVVISITSAEAKGIITKPETLHICYCLTPTRYLWSGIQMYKEHTGFGFFNKIVQRAYSWWLPILRDWDLVASSRPDLYIAISQRVLKRIESYYQQQAGAVIYPPIDSRMFCPSKSDTEGKYYLIVSRLVPYKRIDIVVRACSELKRRLVVIGDGPEKKRLQQLAGTTVQFLSGDLTDKALVRYYQSCRAFLFAGEEDFGIVAAEAQSCGKPVIAYAQSGIAEIVADGKTGVLFYKQTAQDLAKAIIQFEKMIFSTEDIRKNVLRFNKQRFQREMKEFVEQAYKKFKKNL